MLRICHSCDCLVNEDGICPMCKAMYIPEDDWRRILDEEQEAMTPEYSIYDQLRLAFPHGHPRFIELCLGMMELHSKKNYDYAHGGNELGNFNRVSAIKKLYPGIDWTTPAATALDYMLKQQDAVMWSWSQGYEGQVEGKGKKIEDIYIYWPIIRILLEEA